ncbi:MAG: hypothetical protein U0527_10845 [Candidatus Eisenbacteria bacterium]
MPALRSCRPLSTGLAVLLLAVSFSIAHSQVEGVWKTFLYGNEVNDLTAVGEDVYAATGGGLVRLSPDGNLEQWSRSVGGVSSDTLRAVATSPEGEVWIATPRSGISIYSPDRDAFRPFTSLLEPIPGDRIHAVRFREVREQDGGTTHTYQHLLVGAEAGFAVFRDQELRFVCFQGVDLCDLGSFDVRDAEERNDTDTETGPRSIWLATASGVTVQHADGSFEARSIGLASADVTRLFEGRAIAGGRLYRWNGASWELDESGLPGGFVSKDLTRAGATTYLAGDRGVFRREGDTWRQVGTTAINATSIALTASGRLFAGAIDAEETRDGIWEWTGTAWVQHRITGPSLRQHYRSLTFASDGSLWMSHAESGSRPQVIHLSRGEWSSRQGGLTGCVGAWTWRTLEANGQLYLAHCCCSTDEACPLERIDLASNECNVFGAVGNAWDFDRDAEGNLWIASWTESGNNAHGVFRLDARDSTWINLRTANTPELKSNQVTAVRAVGNEVWIGYSQDGVHRLDLGADHLPGTADDSWTWYSKSDANRPLIGDEVRRIEVAPDGHIWIGTTAGISIWKAPRFTNIGAGFGRLPAAQVNELLPLEDGGAWVATKESGITRLTPREGGGFTYESFGPPYLPNPNVEALALSPDQHTLWIGTGRGLATFTPIVAVEAPSGKVSAYPNPLNLGCGEGVRLLGVVGTVSGVVVDLSGEVIHRISPIEPGEVIWDGRDDSGRAVAPGLYWLRLKTAGGMRSVGVGILDGDCSP